MEKTCEGIMVLAKAVSPEGRFLLTIAFVVSALYFSVAFGQSIGKTLFYLTH